MFFFSYCFSISRSPIDTFSNSILYSSHAKGHLQNFPIPFSPNRKRGRDYSRPRGVVIHYAVIYAFRFNFISVPERVLLPHVLATLKDFPVGLRFPRYPKSIIIVALLSLVSIFTFSMLLPPFIVPVARLLARLPYNDRLPHIADNLHT